MLFLLIVLLLIAAGFTMLTKRNRESLFLMGMCCSLMVQFSGISNPHFYCQKGRLFQEHHQLPLFLADAEDQAAISVYYA